MQARRTEAETFRATPSGKTDAGGGWLRVRLEQPGVLAWIECKVWQSVPGGDRLEFLEVNQPILPVSTHIARQRGKAGVQRIADPDPLSCKCQPLGDDRVRDHRFVACGGRGVQQQL